MSHFSVLVPAANDDELEALLLPFHEYESTGINLYTEFVAADMEKLHKEYDESDGSVDFEAFCKAYGLTKNDAGVWGRKTNPNAKWDWWSIGGRFSGRLKLVTGEAVDTARVGDVEIELPTFAFIETNGTWHGRGRMGWFGIVTDDCPDYDDDFSVFWRNLPKDQIVYIVDCHI